MRDLGKMGEMALGLWTGQVGIVCNRAGEDKGGWDYLLQLPPQKASSDVLSLDKIPPGVSCLVQVKATDLLAPPDVKLDNWKRFADPALPSFFLVVNFAGADLPKEAFLVHVDDRWIAKLLKRLRKLSTEEEENLHQHTMRLTWRTADRLTVPNGPHLKARLEQSIGSNPLEYEERKRKWWSLSGFDPRTRFRGTLRTISDGDATAQEQLAEFAIGRIRELPSTLTSLEEVRFGISKPIRPDLPQEVVLSLGKLKPIRKVVTVFSTTTRRAEFETSFFASRSVFPFLRGVYDRYRFACDDFEMVVAPDGGSWKISLSELEPLSLRRLSSLVNFGDLVLMQDEAGNGQQAIEVHVKLDAAKFKFFAGRPESRFNFSSDALRLAEAASDAGVVARTLNLDSDLRVSPANLVAWHDQLRALRAILTTDRKPLLLQGEVNADCPDEIELAHPLVAAAFLGKTLVLIAAAVHGRPKFNVLPGSSRKSFVIPEPSVDVVETVVLEDGSQGSHAAAPYHAKIRDWIERKGYELLANGEQ